MNFVKRFRGVLIIIGIFVIILAISFYLPEQTNETVPQNTDVPVLVETMEPTMDEPVETTEPAKNDINETIAPTPTPVASVKTKEPQEVPVEILTPVYTETIEEEKTLSCSLSVRCDTILNNMENLTPEKVQLVPENGTILPVIELEFSEGDTVFDVLERELKNRKIHFEFSKVSMYDSTYIEGIGNLYEFDCGNLSGWIYRVNGKTPSVGCSQYQLKNGDKIEFLYTCNMGRDL